MANISKTTEKPRGRHGIINARASGEIAPPPPAPRRGVRLRPEHQEEVRAKIQASHLVRLLQEHADGVRDMSPTQVKSAEILLSKSLSSLSSTEVNLISNNDKMSEAEIYAKIAELVQADTRLRALIVPGEACEVAEAPQAVQAPEVVEVPLTCAMCGDEGMPGGCPGCGGDPAEGVA